MRMTQRQFDDAVDGLCQAGPAGADRFDDVRAVRDRHARVYAMALAAIRLQRGIPDDVEWWPAEPRLEMQEFFATLSRRQRRILKQAAENAWETAREARRRALRVVQ